MNLFDLTGKVALVTGASRGLGRHFAATLARAGATVVLAARDAQALKQVQAELGGRSVIAVMDVREPQSIDAAIQTAQQACGRLDVLVNNAGVAATKPFLEQAPQEWSAVVDVNLTGAAHVARAAARAMAAGEGGSIINIASILGIQPAGQVAAYCAAKAGLIQLTRALALELARHRIRVNALAPGYLATDMNRDFFASAAGQAMVKRIPQRRLGELAELDGPLLLLASQAGSYMNGSVITVDGGHTAMGL
jgi:NAD(P)-dependent dehydrogenase (short-subunit alcohol dehydrogenase family)